MQLETLSSNVQRYAVTKNIKLFKTFAKLGFSGELKWTDQTGTQWTFLLNAGHIVYATGGLHPVKRWQRNVRVHCPQLNLDSLRWPFMAETNGAPSPVFQEYVNLCSWLQKNGIVEQPAANFMQGVVEEILFDLSLRDKTTYKLQKKPTVLTTSLPIQIDEEIVFKTVQRLWQSWYQADLIDFLPDQAPVIRKADELRAATNQQLYNVLMTLLDGRHTLRDIAIKTHRDVFQITQALKSYIQLGWIDLVDVLDDSSLVTSFKEPPPASKTTDKMPLIACVDDSPLICQSLETIIAGAGYRYTAIAEPPRAIVKLLSQKPDLIFLDLVMPYTNGYEICSQLRKVSKFKDIPIIILSGNDGVIDQVRARLVGATDFVSKPVEPAIILGMISKYLKKMVPT